MNTNLDTIFLFWHIFFTIFCIFLVWERFVLCHFFTWIFPICINQFWKWFRLFSFFLRLSCNKFISVLICSISWFCFVFGIFILYTQNNFFHAGVVILFINLFMLKLFNYNYFFGSIRICSLNRNSLDSNNNIYSLNGCLLDP